MHTNISNHKDDSLEYHLSHHALKNVVAAELRNPIHQQHHNRPLVASELVSFERIIITD